MTIRRLPTAAQAIGLALLLAALGIGVPVPGHHAHHHGDGAHVGPPGHGHGVALLQCDRMRVERPAPPQFVAGPTLSFVLPLDRPRALLLPPREEPSRSSRAPPSTTRPRAPPA